VVKSVRVKSVRRKIWKKRKIVQRLTVMTGMIWIDIGLNSMRKNSGTSLNRIDNNLYCKHGGDKDKENLRDILVDKSSVAQLKYCKTCKKESCTARQKKGSCRVVIFSGIVIRAPIPRIGKEPLIYSKATGFANVIMISETISEICAELKDQNVAQMKRTYEDE
jgi:hypothetical protein